MTDEVAVWRRLSALLPTEDAQDVMACWNIGEQEGGLQLLVSALQKHQVAIDETTRVEIAVVCETWGMWPVPLESLPRPDSGDGSHSTLRLVEDDATAPLPGTTVGLHDRLLVVPWIGCTACGRTLARAHTREPWGDLSYVPEHYVVLDADPGVAAPHVFAPEGVRDALAALRTSCERPEHGQVREPTP
ncbi:hypothetical protein ACF07T_09095 [Streptomyces sp. NPDC015184]|uniref:hypothetical protein n=1 Tax=Streptomyces sp. NPDC015184 TaxID=3364946 RepID=UPI0036FA2A92